MKTLPLPIRSSLQLEQRPYPSTLPQGGPIPGRRTGSVKPSSATCDVSSVLRLLFMALLAVLSCAPVMAQNRPAITSFTPTQGPTTTLVTITGTNFNRDINGNLWSGTAPYTVQFGTSGGATPTVLSSTQIRVAVPSTGVSGRIRLRAFGAGQLIICESSTSYIVSTVTRPAITTFTPASGPVGTQITINGSNFNRDSLGNTWTGTPPYRVQFNNLGTIIEAIPTFISNTQIRVTVPAGTGIGPSALRLRQNGVSFNSSNSNFTTTAPSVLRITNNTQYNVVSLTLNGQQMFAPGSGVLSNSTVDVPVSSGTFTMVAGVGFVSASGVRDIWFNFTRTVTITSGQTNSQTLARITVGQLLTMGVASRNWDGIFFDNNGAPHGARFVFSSNGGWQFFSDGVAQGSGTVTEVSWPNSSPTVTFRVNNTLPAITIASPFGQFLLQNGPPSWRVIQYIKQ